MKFVFSPNTLFLAIAVAFVSLHTTEAQEVRFSSGIQVGTYAMDDLKSLQSYIAAPEVLNARVTDDFSPSIGFQGSFLYVGNKAWGAGVEFGHLSAYGKVVGDNPKVMFFEHRANLSTIGATAFVILNKRDKPLEISLTISSGGTFGKFRKRYPDLEKGPQTERYFTRGLYAAGGPALTYKFNHWFVNAKAQYLYDFGGRLKRTDATDMRLRNADGDELGLDWSGLRVSIGVGARLAY